MRKALVVIDYQVDFVSGSLGGADAVSIESALFERVSEALVSGETVIFTKDTHDSAGYMDTDEGHHIPVMHCIKGTEGHEIYGKLRELAAGCRVYEKGTFGCPELASDLASEGYDEIEVCGVATNVCVISNAVLIKTNMPECRVCVNPAHVASYDPELGREALRVMASMCIDVVGI